MEVVRRPIVGEPSNGDDSSGEEGVMLGDDFGQCRVEPFSGKV